MSERDLHWTTDRPRTAEEAFAFLRFGTVARPLGSDEIVDQVRTDLRMERAGELLRQEREQLIEALGVALGERRYAAMTMREVHALYAGLVKELEGE